MCVCLEPCGELVSLPQCTQCIWDRRWICCNPNNLNEWINECVASPYTWWVIPVTNNCSRCLIFYFFLNILSSSSLSYRFGDGYTIILRLSALPPDPCPVDAYIQSRFPGIELKERHHNVLQYQLPTHACSLAHVFNVLSNKSEELGIAEYSVSQTTLDQVRTPHKRLHARMWLFQDKTKSGLFLSCRCLSTLPRSRWTTMTDWWRWP